MIDYRCYVLIDDLFLESRNHVNRQRSPYFEAALPPGAKPEFDMGHSLVTAEPDWDDVV